MTPADARRARFAKVAPLIPRGARILDVGGELAYWLTVDWQAIQPRQIVLFNLSLSTVPEPFESVVGDARDLSRYTDKAFDVVFSNSVIGHVGGPADRARMAREIQRVGCQWIVQTPNRWFPIDWHTRVPGFHWLPSSLQAVCYRLLPVGTYPRAQSWQIAQQRATRIHHLTKGDLRELFPQTRRVVPERYAGFVKSYTIVGP